MCYFSLVAQNKETKYWCFPYFSSSCVRVRQWMLRLVAQNPTQGTFEFFSVVTENYLPEQKIANLVIFKKSYNKTATVVQNLVSKKHKGTI